MFLSELSLGLGRNSRGGKRRSTELFVSVFENNYSQIIAYLGANEHFRIKLICRGIYYLSVSSEIWLGIRTEVVDKKMENFEDIQFVEEQVKSSKEQKQIRIHSLKKNNQLVKNRQASNVKQKKLALSTLNNQLPFRSTEIGFKRLLKTNLAPKTKTGVNKQSQFSQIDLLQIPNGWGVKELIINVKDPWSLNVQRASNICTLVKRWNQFHHSILSELKSPQKDLSSLVKKCIKVDKQLSEYFKKFELEPHLSLKRYLDGSEKQLLIDEQLNRLGTAFILQHNLFSKIAQQLEHFISKTHETLIKLSKFQSREKQSTWVIDYLSALQEMLQDYCKIGSLSPQLLKNLSKSIAEIVDNLFEDLYREQIEIDGNSLEIQNVSLSSISKKSDFFQVFFESIQACINCVLRIGEGGEQENLGINLVIGKFKSFKSISHHLWNISKYFSKLGKQLQSKEKKGGSNKQVSIIRSFIQSYQNHKVLLFDWKNPQKVEKEVVELKSKVANLKNIIQAE